MGKVNIISDEMLRVMRRELRKHGVTLVRNRKTQSIHLRLLNTEGTSPDTEAQAAERQAFTECSRRVSQWKKENGPEAFPPNGTEEYQEKLKAFRRQKKIKRFDNFLISKFWSSIN